MAKKRVHEIAKAQGLTSKDLLAALKAAGVEAKAAQSSVEESDALAALKNSGGGTATATATQTKAKPAAKSATKAATPAKSKSDGAAKATYLRQQPFRVSLAFRRAHVDHVAHQSGSTL